MRERTHELKVFANAHHKTARSGELILHLWFIGSFGMELDLDIALHRPDVGCVDVIDCVKHTTERLYPGARKNDPRPPARRQGGRGKHRSKPPHGELQ